MRIAYVITRSDEVGGAHVHLLDLAVWMSNHGHDVKVYVGGDGIYTDKLKDANIKYFPLTHMKRPFSFHHDLLAIKELRSEFIKFPPDIVACHSAKAGMVARIVCKLLNIPCVFTAHGWSFADGIRRPNRDLYLLIERSLAYWADRIITVCEADRSYAIKNNVGVPDKIVTIHNGMPDVDEQFISMPIMQPPRLIMVARFEAQKDHFSLIKALSFIKDQEWTIDFIGDGPLLSSVVQMSKELGVFDRIRFLGRRWDVPDLLANSDIFLLCSLWEGFPLSIIEAMRAGLPVVATNVAGVVEAVLDGKTGFLVNPQDINHLESKLRILIQDAHMRKSFGLLGRQRYRELFTFQTMAEKTLHLYNSVMVNSEKKSL